MSINGSISVNALFHDTDGTTSLKIVSLKSSDEYTTGKVAILTGTAGTAAVSFSNVGATTYRDASGALVAFNEVNRIAFSWSGSPARLLTESYDNAFLLRSKSGRVAVSEANGMQVQPVISAGIGTGTYTIVLYGT